MKFTINAKPFAQLLMIVGRAIDSRPALPILSNVLLETDGVDLRATGTSIDLTIYSSERCETLEKGAVTLPVKELAALVNRFDEAVTVTLDENTQSVSIQSGKVRARLNGIDAREFPPDNENESEQRFELDRKTLLRAITSVIYAINPNHTEMARRGAAFKFEDRRLMLFANEGTRMATCVVPLETVVETAVEVIVPQRTLMETLAILSRSASDKVMLSLASAGNAIYFDDSDVSIASQVIAGTLARDMKAMLGEPTGCVQISREQLERSLGRMSIFASDSNNSCLFSLTEEGLSLSSKSQERGEVNDLLEVVNADGDTIHFTLNLRYLLDALNSFTASATINLNLHLIGKNQAVSLTSGEETDLMAVMSPMAVR